jgi:DNA polymerase I-like protein with 3'-5' exonuclease and polymerase domains
LEGTLPHGAEVIGHTHDELLFEVPSRDETVVREVAEFASREMVTAPCWLAGLPLNIEWKAGHRYGIATLTGTM